MMRNLHGVGWSEIADCRLCEARRPVGAAANIAVDCERSVAHTCSMPVPKPSENDLLRALSAAELKRLRPHLESFPMPLGHVVYESGRILDHVYFPTTSIVSLLYVMEDGASAEIAVVGHEGLVGISLFMGGETTPSRAVVQSAGDSFRLAARYLREEFSRSGSMQHLLLRYTQSLITQDRKSVV